MQMHTIHSTLLAALLLLAPAAFMAQADEVEKVLFLVVEKDDVIASNTRSGRFDRLDLQAKERIRDYKVSNAVAVVVTNQRLVAYGVQAGGWQATRIEAGERVERIEVEDYSATVVTNDRILNFYGRSGAWSHVRRGVQLR
ncbi:MAG TPA: hypothetical protein ENK49_13020 [Gammaproteobacteria bacterium]|nr:hypothetical protein [Gammaproteobacteria bacterium]